MLLAIVAATAAYVPARRAARLDPMEASGRMRLSCFLCVSPSIAAISAAWPPSRQPADLVLRNGKIVTMNSAAPVAQAIARARRKISALGSEAEAAKWIGPRTQVIDLHGKPAIPGFIEGHGHFTGVGEFRMGLDLREARTWDDIVSQVARAVEAGQARRMDYRPRLASVEVDACAGAECRRLPAARLARQGLAQ